MWVPGRITFARGALSAQDNVTHLDRAFSCFHYQTAASFVQRTSCAALELCDGISIKTCGDNHCYYQMIIYKQSYKAMPIIKE
ncbi:hypothetical protein BpHYR1_000948 [Brachionus plicatilis]|uniref:Uncharacterized protein n=1 Tax=Brachionus plicatilis TaxID=10195 RepID=A0A3M7RSE7_BRAPC|nr:hypothetical protein BpHYR1_000948 [Brachionus plicatilis]